MLKLGFHYQPDHPRIKYTINFIRQHPLSQASGLEIQENNEWSANDLNITYGPLETTSSPDLVIPDQHIFFAPKTATGPFYANSYNCSDKTIYSVESRQKAANSPSVIGKIFQFDLLETIFFHVSRYEEVFAAADQNNDSGWLEETQHVLIRSGLQQIPVVDQLMAVFLQLLTGKEPIVPTTYDLSHDIDFLYRYPNILAFLRALLGSFYRREGLSNIGQHWRLYRDICSGKAKDPYDCFDWLFSRAEQWQQKTLYLMAGGETKYDNHYSPEHPKIRELIELARSRGYLLGLHPSYNAAFKPALFEAEKEKLEQVSGQVIAHSRQHWLRWDWSTTPYIIRQLHLQEDASIGYRRHLGFRAGTGFPFQLYDFQSETPFAWLERPLSLMDSAVLHEAKSTGMAPSRLLEAFLQQHSMNTHISLNFHNSNFDAALPNGHALTTYYRNSILSPPN